MSVRLTNKMVWNGNESVVFWYLRWELESSAEVFWASAMLVVFLMVAVVNKKRAFFDLLKIQVKD